MMKCVLANPPLPQSGLPFSLNNTNNITIHYVIITISLTTNRNSVTKP